MNLEAAKNFFLNYPNGDKVTFETVVENETVVLKCYANGIEFTSFPIENLPLIAKILNDMYFAIVYQNKEAEDQISN